MKLTGLKPLILVALALMIDDAKAIISSQSEDIWREHFLQSPTKAPQVPIASFTQNGYIQFLKYVVDVPEITDYTFCLWVKSHNLTYDHPLLSYSKHEKERLIRVWISPHGTHINLELMGKRVFTISSKIVENQWNHLCQSWSSHMGTWAYYLNGNLHSSGHRPLLRNVRIPSGGDLVVGQEYTDFDKGLDDGIEGAVSGFNFVLSSSFSRKHDLIRRQEWEDPHEPLGMLLVKLGQNCGLLRGAPLSGKEVLVSWTKTEVRVFGGATLKMTEPFCVQKR